MSQISYVRKFQHKSWTDFVDPVQAGGENGLNQRFLDLIKELDAIKRVLDALGQPPAARPQTLTLAPALVTASGDSGWVQRLGLVQSPSGGAAVDGFMPIALPNGATVQALRVTGSSAGGRLVVKLVRQPLLGGGTSVDVVQAIGDFPEVTTAAPFSIPPTPQAATAVVENETSKYYLVASLSGAPTAANRLTSITGFQITYAAL